MNLIFKIALKSFVNASGAAYLQIIALATTFVIFGILHTLLNLYMSPSILGAGCSENARWVTLIDTQGTKRDRFFGAEIQKLQNSASTYSFIKYIQTGGMVESAGKSKDLNVAFVDDAIYESLCISTEMLANKRDDSAGVNAVFTKKFVTENSFKSDIFFEKKLITSEKYLLDFEGFFGGEGQVQALLSASDSQLFGYDIFKADLPITRILVVRKNDYSWSDVESELKMVFSKNKGAFPEEKDIEIQSSLAINAESSSLLGSFLSLLSMVSACLILLVLCALFIYQISRTPKLHSSLALLNCLGARKKDLFAFIAIEPFVVILVSILVAFLIYPYAYKFTIYTLNDSLLRSTAAATNTTYLGFLVVAAFIFVCLVIHRASISFRAKFSESGEKNRNSPRLRFYLTATQVIFSAITLSIAFSSTALYLKSYPWGMNLDPVNLRIKFIGGKNGVSHPLLESKINSALKKASMNTNNEIAFADNTLPIGLPLLTAMEAKVNGIAVQGRINYVSPNFFDVLKLPIISGTSFYNYRSPSDSTEPNVVLINTQLSTLLFKNKNPIGQTFFMKTEFTKKGDPAFQVKVVGVVDEGSAGNASRKSIRSLKPMAYMPFSKIHDNFPGFVMFVRNNSQTGLSEGDDLEILNLSKELIQFPRIDFSVTALQMIKSETRKELSLAVMFLIVAFGTLSLAALGVISIVKVSRLQSQKFRAICYSIGAPNSLIKAKFVKEQSRPVIFGLTSGAFASFCCCILMGMFVPTDNIDTFIGIFLSTSILAIILFNTIRHEAKKITPEEMLSVLSVSGEAV
jgi:MacB-like periplasmic core domain